MQETHNNIKQFLQERKWDKLKPADLAKSISIEAAELLELFQWSNESLDEVKGNSDKLVKVKKELADVMIYCFNMAVLLDLDVKELIQAKLDHNKEKYPVHLDQAGYEQRKREYRMKGI